MRNSCKSVVPNICPWLYSRLYLFECIQIYTAADISVNTCEIVDFVVWHVFHYIYLSFIIFIVLYVEIHNLSLSYSGLILFVKGAFFHCIS